MDVCEEIKAQQQRLYATLNTINENTWNNKQQVLAEEVELINKISAQLNTDIVRRLVKSKTARVKLKSVIIPLTNQSFIKGASYPKLKTANVELDKLVLIQELEEEAQIQGAKAVLEANGWERLAPYIEDGRYLKLVSALQE
ncbi:MAG: hypothetical protein ATN33_01420 [Epulopiscium sp. Nele67-Bin001]|nr:MAG: hypothetical protein BEN18_02585 [Epulopiscium sp. Nuni2H_MBin001]OON91349.1 MAG: hypothetical protein ATN33_01420 [Epulopiscium sp. Nele67-Bin001]